MKRKSTKDILSVIHNFQTFIKNKPEPAKMFSEIRMMKFKVRPIQGDLSTIDLRNEHFIEALWSLGKLDEFFQSEYPKLSSKDKDIFMKIFDDLYHKFQQELNRISIYKGPANKKDKVLELEIYKEAKNRKIN